MERERKVEVRTPPKSHLSNWKERAAFDPGCLFGAGQNTGWIWDMYSLKCLGDTQGEMPSMQMPVGVWNAEEGLEERHKLRSKVCHQHQDPHGWLCQEKTSKDHAQGTPATGATKRGEECTERKGRPRCSVQGPRESPQVGGTPAVTNADSGQRWRRQ